jgi:hypothetical protein
MPLRDAVINPDHKFNMPNSRDLLDSSMDDRPDTTQTGRSALRCELFFRILCSALIQHISFVWRRQHDDHLGVIRTNESAHGGEAAVLIDAPTAGLAR